MRIGLYGMPTSGKTYILNQIDFIDVIEGSKMLHKLCPDFDSKSNEEKKQVRIKLVDYLNNRETFIMDGHYSFGDDVVFTESDGEMYDAFLYLYVSPDSLKRRMNDSERNRKYLEYDIEKWQRNEVESLREYCHNNKKDFYVVDNPVENSITDVVFIVDFIKTIVKGYSCVSFAKKCALSILSKCDSETIKLMDGDKTIVKEDTSNKVFGYTTHVFDGNFYTGYQAWRQADEMKNYSLDKTSSVSFTFNEKVAGYIDKNTFILTSGHEEIWHRISQNLNVSFYCGREMSAETKLYVTMLLQETGKKVIAYGDGMIDYYMLKQADEGFLVARQDSSISKSLNNKNLEGLVIV